MDKRTKEYKDGLKKEESINNVEDFNGEVLPEFKEKSGMSQWSEEEMIQSMINTCRVLPGNLMRNGRHTKENIQALNVFKITDELIDKVYENHYHDDFAQLVRIPSP
jgi:hypothetical protein